MHDRRTFFRQLLAGAAVSLGFKAEDLARAQTAVAQREIPKGFYWKTTIFCQFGDPKLLADIGMIAQKLGCDIYPGEPFTYDVIAIPYFVVILDRSTLSIDQWHSFLEFREEAGDKTTCILVGGLGDGGGWSVDEYMEFRDPGNEEDVKRILMRIRDAHAQLE